MKAYRYNNNNICNDQTYVIYHFIHEKTNALESLRELLELSLHIVTSHFLDPVQRHGRESESVLIKANYG